MPISTQPTTSKLFAGPWVIKREYTAARCASYCEKIY